MKTDLTKEEQTNVRTALRFLHRQLGGWTQLSKALQCAQGSLSVVVNGRTVTPRLAFRIARFANVGVDDVLTGRYPDPRACPLCGHIKGAPQDE